MKRSMLLLVTLLALLVSLAAALADTDSETPNDPRVNPNANACYTGGSMEGKCKLDDELWNAGWYAIRFQYGLIGRNQVPDQYKWILPPASEPNNAAEVTDEPVGANPTSPFNTSTPMPTREFPTPPPKPATATPVPTLTPTPITPTATFTAGPPPTFPSPT